MTDPAGTQLPADLEARLVVVAAAADGNDFDGFSWFWILVLGAVLPVALILGGWFLGPAAP